MTRAAYRGDITALEEKRKCQFQANSSVSRAETTSARSLLAVTVCISQQKYASFHLHLPSTQPLSSAEPDDWQGWELPFSQCWNRLAGALPGPGAVSRAQPPVPKPPLLSVFCCLLLAASIWVMSWCGKGQALGNRPRVGRLVVVSSRWISGALRSLFHPGMVDSGISLYLVLTLGFEINVE